MWIPLKQDIWILRVTQRPRADNPPVLATHSISFHDRMRRIAFSVLSEGLPTGAGLVWESMIGLELIAAMSFNVNECACNVPLFHKVIKS
jgi:hypothetical protein